MFIEQKVKINFHYFKYEEIFKLMVKWLLLKTQNLEKTATA